MGKKKEMWEIFKKISKKNRRVVKYLRTDKEESTHALLLAESDDGERALLFHLPVGSGKCAHISLCTFNSEKNVWTEEWDAGDYTKDAYLNLDEDHEFT